MLPYEYIMMRESK